MTKIVNLYKEKYDVYIGRPGKGRSGYYGNPINKSEQCCVCNNIHNESGSTLECYKTYFHFRLENDEEFKKNILSLKGKVLGCFCKPKPCHGDIIVEFLEGKVIQ